jgi:hypothetical protein
MVNNNNNHVNNQNTKIIKKKINEKEWKSFPLLIQLRIQLVLNPAQKSMKRSGNPFHSLSSSESSLENILFSKTLRWPYLFEWQNSTI